MDKENKNNNRIIDYKSIVQGYVVKNARKRKIVNNLITVYCLCICSHRNNTPC